MSVKGLLWLAIVGLAGYTPAHANDVVFPSGSVLTAVDESTLDAATLAQVADPLNTGTPLFKVTTPLDDNVQLSRSFLVRSVRFPGSDTDYYRAHPALFDCLQNTYDHIINTVGKELQIVTGYLTADEMGASPEAYELYARTGCGAVLNLNQAVTTSVDVKEIAGVIMTYCPAIFSLELRNIGVVQLADKVHVYMAAPDVATPFYSAIGESQADTLTWSMQKIDASLLPFKLPECSYYDGLDANQVSPTGKSMEQAVGSMDVPVTRDSEDFKRLLQFPGSEVVFEDTESGSSWCGSSGNPCAACGSAPVGEIAVSRCADRLMAPRLYNVVKSIHGLVNIIMNPVKLKVVEAWDEAHSGAPSGDTTADSLHREGRAAVLQLSSGNTAANIKILTQYALCSGADYVKNEGDRVTIAVKKQAGLEEKEIRFVLGSLLEVSPPASLIDTFVLPENSDPADFPLLDADNQETLELGELCTVGDFKSPSTRYFRLHPDLVRCFDKVQQSEDKWFPDISVRVEVVRGYLTEAELMATFNPRFDKRRRAHVHGTGMHITYEAGLHGGNFSQADGTTFSAYRLASSILLNCAPIFSESSGMEMGLGMYGDGIYVDMRENFLVWLTDPDMLPLGESRDTLRQKYLWAVDYRMFNPDDPVAACSPGTPPLPKSTDYQHVHLGYVHARRRKRQAGVTDDDCQPTTGTEYCAQTETFRNNEIAHIWHEMKRKHMFRHEDDVYAALQGCFGTCGTCTKGEYWEDKVEHCNNLMHWMPFELMNEAADVTNLYFRGNRHMKNFACHRNDRHCVDKAPLFAILAPSVEALYRPDPKKSVEDELYDSLENPSPVPEVAYEIYGMHANGTVNVWVQDASEMEYLRASLKPIMAYNKAVTKVVVYVLPADDSEQTAEEVKADVANQLDNMIKDWTTSICPSLARYATPPVIFKDVHAGISRRDIHVERDFTEELAWGRKHHEQVWIAKTLS